MKWIDIHTHLNMLEVSPEEAIEQARQAGVERMITIGTGPDDLSLVLEISKKHPEYVYCTLGVHPHDAKLFNPEVKKFIQENVSLPQVVAVGETGLDYYYEHSERDVQKAAFREQIELAIENNLPVEIHTRDAEDDTVNILKDYKGQVKGLLHCFTGTQWLADQALDLGLNISISGIVTFKKADELKQVVKSIPLDRLHVETDAPFLAPMPHRGKKNVPAYVVHTAEVVAELKGITLEELSAQTQKNALKMFSKLKWEN